MINPVEIGNNLKESYLRYIKAGLPLMEEYYEKEREHLYREDGIITHPPYIEIVKKYEGKKSLSDICKENQINPEVASFLNRGLLLTENGEERHLYEHQERAIIDVLKNKKHMVITTGTGSGKTESFLIPLLADIIEESLSWKQNDKETALRSIIFYPLNALAEDQMVRLRKSLVREEVNNWYEERQIANHITFGRYISRTPKSKSDSKYREIKYRWDSITQTIDNTRDEKRKKELQSLIYTGPCCNNNSAEIVDRKSMRDDPPDILITNYSMLNIMLMRKAEQPMFDKTRKWLSNNKDNMFTLVIDELHTYRGTAGTEVAYIIKVLLHRLGLSPSSPQVRFLASSASMSASVDSQKYISDFFGTDNTRFSSLFTLISDKPEEEIIQSSLPPLPLEKFAEIAKTKIDENISCEEAINKLFQSKELITGFVKTNKLPEWLKYALRDTKTNSISAKSTIDIADSLFKGPAPDDKKTFLEIFLLLINLAEDDDKIAYQPLRAHYFLRNIEKIYMCVNKDCDAVDPDFKNESRQYGKIYNQPITRCTCGSLVYEAIVCRHCGELYFCGYGDHDGKLVNVPDVYNPRKPNVFYKPDMSFYQDNEIEGWKRVDLDIKTGQIRPNRHGQYFQYRENEFEKSELPTTCPRCDFTTRGLRNSDFSALFRHGTGVQKVNQVCADTLMQILAKSDEPRKLVIFSDSRQSAAKLAAGIELDHYRDALRQTALLSFKSNARLLECLKKLRNGEIKELPEGYKESIKKDKYLREIRRDILEENDGDLSISEKEKLDQKLSGINPTLEYIIALIMENLIKAGLNPAGPYPSVFYVDPKNKDKKWYECVNADGTGFETDTDQKDKYYKKVYNLCRTEILKIMLGSPKRSFESLGLGYYHVRSSIKGIEPGFLDSIVRIIGESNRIFSNETEEQRSFPKRLWGYFKAVKNENTGNHPMLNMISDNFIQNKILRADNDRRLTGENIVFIPAKAGDNVWECRKCKTKHLHNSGGKCTYCFSDLPKTPREITTEELTGTYYTRERKTDKLHCEELTGQTNTQDALDRQRLFQDILYDRERPNVDNIELLSVTTTMEAGVDIGPLLAIMMGNVPPQRFNYQQRVGRAGRRGSPLSIALTVARANSHDQVHYANPERIVSGEPMPPYLDFSSKDIFKRIVYKEILKQAFDDCDISTGQDDSVHGQFGKVYDWKNNKSIIEDWLKHQGNINTDYNYLIGEYEDDTIKTQKGEILKNIQSELINNIEQTISDKNFNQMHLSERLAAGGRLPMFGFPTQVRNLYESVPGKLPAENVTERHMDLALVTFAPGSEIVKDKKIYLSTGFIDFESRNGRPTPVDGLMEYDNQVLYQCPECWYTAVHDKNDMIKSCPICEHAFDKEKGEICDDICSPKGYCADFSEEPKDFDGNFNWNPVKISARIDSKVTREIKLKSILNTNLKFGNNVIPEKGLVRTINTNNSGLFTIRKTNNNGWVVPDLVNFPTSPANERHIALVTTKITGIIILAIHSENGNICLNPLYKGGIGTIDKVRPQLLRSAFLSWGELIRKSVTGFLDIRSNELSIDYSVRRDADGSAPYPSIYMMEQLENGAGYTDYLASLASVRQRDIFINSLISGGEIYDSLTGKHQTLCDTACYDCLCDYNNQQKHGLLNWRLGLDIGLLSNDNKFIPSYTDNDSHWNSILTKIEDIISKQRESGIQLIKEKDYWYTLSENSVNFIYHPLWSDDYILDKAKKIDYLQNNVRYVSLLEFINNPI